MIIRALLRNKDTASSNSRQAKGNDDHVSVRPGKYC
jgi:hypothetical protein